MTGQGEKITIDFRSTIVNLIGFYTSVKDARAGPVDADADLGCSPALSST